jgi:hypothetical protein
MVSGQYDTLERGAEEAVLKRIHQLRDYMIDQGLYHEAVFHLMSYAVPTDSDNQLCSNHSSLYQTAVLEDKPWALRSEYLTNHHPYRTCELSIICEESTSRENIDWDCSPAITGRTGKLRFHLIFCFKRVAIVQLIHNFTITPQLNDTKHF